ncbi:glycosyltransferase family 2 protein [Streptomyces sp. NPDC017936]|uniref:glycosyltransferase family 2 protein n=1 Tax=Streptomyces sp. NPDC017936 TaxID=3365016 RepID=UPI0037B5A140
MTQLLAVLVPTRGRPQNAIRLQQAFDDTDSLNAVPVFVVDSDDPELPVYWEAAGDRAIRHITVHEGATGTGMTAALNHAARHFAGEYEALGFMGDDHLPRTAGWDAHVLGALGTGEPRIVYGDDLLQGERLPTAAFMPSRMVRALGYMAPPVLRHLYVDNFWLALGLHLDGLRYLPHVVIEHLHPAAGKASMDARYAAVNATEADMLDRQAWRRFRDGDGFASALRRVRAEYGRDAS